MGKRGTDRDAGDNAAAGLIGQLVEVARLLPGSDIAEQQLGRAERLLLGELKRRLDRLAPDPALPPPPAAVSSNVQQRFATLLDRALEQDRDEAALELCDQIVDRLVADEARLIAALSDGERHPLVHVGTGPVIGPVSRWLAENLSSVGKQAGVKLLELVPEYIGHLRELNLLVTGPEDTELEIQYQVIESSREVKAFDEVGNLRFVRRTIRLSEFGQRFWEIVNPGASGNG